MRNTVQLLVLPPDLSPSALQGLVLELSHSFYIFCGEMQNLEGTEE